VFIGSAIGSESFGIVLVEAMAAGLPVVVSDIAGYREVVRPDVEGLLVPPSDPDALAAGVRRVLGDEALAFRLAEAGRQRALLYSWDTIAARIDDIYYETVNPTPQGLAVVAS
jgi:glycosyltransferase involved in cell wall biosynthesis